MTMKRTIAFGLIVLFSLAGHAAAQDAGVDNWRQWRGPNNDGVAPNAKPPVTWSEDSNVRWKIEIPGEGHSTPIIWGDRIYLLTAVQADGENRDFTVLCLNRDTGAEIWKDVAITGPQGQRHETNTYASASAVTDGERLYFSFGSHGIFCYTMDGQKVWDRDLGDQEVFNNFGEAASPALHGDTLVVNWDHQGQSFIVALNTADGQDRWRKDRDEGTTWATPLVVEHEGRTQVITNAQNRVRSYDLASGDLIWECGGQVRNPIPSPVKFEDLVIVTTGYQGNALYAIPLNSTGDLTGTDRIAWNNGEIGSYVATPVVYNGKLYITKERNAVVACFDARTGREVFGETRLPDSGTLYSSPVAADGKIYFASREGSVAVLEAGEEFKLLAVNKLDEGISATPAVVGDRMYIRGEKHLYCIAAP
jgi:outer membrane protein assembly factor BamB